MKDIQQIRLDKNLNAITKVYRIAKELKNENKIDTDLYYAILEMKDENLDKITFDPNDETVTTPSYFDDFA